MALDLSARKLTAMPNVCESLKIVGKEWRLFKVGKFTGLKFSHEGQATRFTFSVMTLPMVPSFKLC